MVGNFLQSILGGARAIPQAIPMIDPNTGLPVDGPVLNGQTSAPRNFDEAFAPFMNLPAAGPTDLLEGTPYSADAMAAPAPAPQQAQAPQAPGQPPRQRRSLLETIGGVADVLARVGGAEALYQPTLDAREDRQRSIDLDEMRQTLLEQQISAGEQAPEEMMRGRIAQALGAVALNPEMASMWPQIAQEAGIDPQRAEAIGQIIQSNPAAAGILAQSLGFAPPRQASQPKEEAIYGMLLQEGGPEMAKAYLQKLANPNSLSPYQAGMLDLAMARLGFDQDKFERTEARAEEEAASPAANLTPGQKKLDQAFGSTYNDYVARGGFADVQKGISQLKEVRDALEGGGLTGGITGYLPTTFRSVVNEDSVSAQEAVEEVVQRNLRLILGAQFTQKEGERLIERSYNPRLSEEENIRRLDRLIKQLETSAQETESAAEYFEENGTLNGWKGNLPGTRAPTAPRRSAPAPRRQSSSTARPAQRRSLSPAAAEARRRGLID